MNKLLNKILAGVLLLFLLGAAFTLGNKTQSTTTSTSTSNPTTTSTSTPATNAPVPKKHRTDCGEKQVSRDPKSKATPGVKKGGKSDDRSTKKSPSTTIKTTGGKDSKTNCHQSPEKPTDKSQSPWPLLALGVSAIAVSVTYLSSRNRRQASDLAPIETAFDQVPNDLVRDVRPSQPLNRFLSPEGHSMEKFAKAFTIIGSDPSQAGATSAKQFNGGPAGAVGNWALENGDGLFGAFWSEKIPDNGEDAIPLMVVGRRDGIVVSGVFDGLGGSGAARIDWVDGRSVSHAWESSRITRSTIEQELARAKSLKDAAFLNPTDLASVIQARLLARSEELSVSDTGLASSLARVLPTTFAGFTIDYKQSKAVEAYWAGDSRAYVLDINRGLQVLTRDDAEDMDAFDSLNVDPPLTNVICADRPFVIHSKRVSLPASYLVIAATDGCFNYWPTPANFEFEILNAIISNSSWSAALQALGQSIGSVTKDDTSLTIAAVGFKGFKGLQSALATRHRELYALTYEPLARLKNAGGTRDEFEEYRHETWKAYKTNYEALLGGLS